LKGEDLSERGSGVNESSKLGQIDEMVTIASSIVGTMIRAYDIHVVPDQVVSLF
jgi:hypothetical protein